MFAVIHSFYRERAVWYFSDDQKTRWSRIGNFFSRCCPWGWRASQRASQLPVTAVPSERAFSVYQHPFPLWSGSTECWAMSLFTGEPQSVGCWVNHQAACSRVGSSRCRFYTVSQNSPEGLSTSCPQGNLHDSAYSLGFPVLPVFSFTPLISWTT